MRLNQAILQDVRLPDVNPVDGAQTDGLRLVQVDGGHHVLDLFLNVTSPILKKNSSVFRQIGKRRHINDRKLNFEHF